MFVAAIDDRHVTPEYVFTFLEHTIRYCDLNYISPANDLSNSGRPDLKSSRFQLRTIDPASMPLYQRVKQLFDDLFVNYSPNSDSFEKSCFLRWFALNAATASLSDNEYICLLDTDFLIGMCPSEVLSNCWLSGSNKGIQIATDWQYASREKDEIPIELIPFVGMEKNLPKTMSPHISIMTKAFLFDFCKFTLTTYYSPGNKENLVGQYFDSIGKTADQGISDMTALAAYSTSHHYEDRFNLKNIDSLEVIGNFNIFLHGNAGKGDNWQINFKCDGATLKG